MSYGAPPPPPPPPPGPPQAPYGQLPPPPPHGHQPRPYAHWGRRVAGTLIDSACLLPFYLVAGVGLVVVAAAQEGGGGAAVAVGVVVAALGYIGAVAFAIWNQVFRQGRTGQSFGKGVMHIRLLDERTGRPVGPLMSFLRHFVHVIDSAACYIGWLWPLWDEKRQTFTDKILSTVVVEG